MISVNMVEADVYEVVIGQRVGSALQRGEVNITEETTVSYTHLTLPTMFEV